MLSSDVLADLRIVIFGVVWILSVIQFYFTFPETCDESLEEIEFLFFEQGSYAWTTRPGESRLDALVEEAPENHLNLDDANDHGFNSIGASMKHVEGSGKQVRMISPLNLND